MNKIIVLLFGAFIGFKAFAFNAPQSKAELCAERIEIENVKSLTEVGWNLMSFRNQGGFAKKGVCWWHSRFQRNALYLTYYNPNALADSYSTVIQKIKKIREGRELVQINGFSNFYEFTVTYQNLIQDELNRWQKSDGLAKFKWINGLKGKSRVAPEVLFQMMNELYYQVAIEKKIVYQKLQVAGITAHSWLVVNMEPYQNGYVLEVIDSNLPTMKLYYQYIRGMTHFVHSVYGDFTPYTEYEAELENIFKVINKSCYRPS